MRHAFFSAPRPLVFAHRGGAALAPENTLAAFDNGLAIGADGIELDVRLSLDGVVVVHHDRTLERRTRLRGELAAHTARQLAAVGVPTLEEVLTRYPQARLIVEMKENTPAFARAVVEVVVAAAAADRVCLGAFSTGVLKTARALAPKMATSASRDEVRWALYRSWCRWPAPRAPYVGYQIPETAGATRVVSRRFIDDAHRAGLGVQVWTVDREDEARRLLDWGADGLITDRPDLIVPLLRPRSGAGSAGMAASRFEAT